MRVFRASTGRGLLAACLVLLATFPVRASETSAPGPDHLRISDVEVVLSPVGPVVLLKAGQRAIPVFVDATVAESIHAALQKQKLPRPLTHELVRTLLEAYDGRVDRVVVTLVEQTFHGALTVTLGGTTRVFDSRSSDAIALAVHFAAPIWVSRELLETAGKPLAVPGGRSL